MPSKSRAVLTSTIAATPRLFLRTPPQPAHNRYAGLAEPRSRNRGLSSPAGLHRRPWLARLRRALEEDLFVLHYQPIMSLEDRSVSHYEALVRLADEPGGGLVAPGRFLPAAERYGLIREIDRMVLSKVIALLGDRSPAGEHGVRIAINCSSLSITDGEMLDQIERALALAGVDPGQLVIEVTETAAISDMARARDFCAGVQALGCAVALDDFGAGFGSFQYLKHLPFEYLKIDGDFIRGCRLRRRISWWSRRSWISREGWASRRLPSTSRMRPRWSACATRGRLRAGVRGRGSAAGSAACGVEVAT